MEKKTVYLTEEGYQELKQELDDLINVKRPLNIKAIKEARALAHFLLHHIQHFLINLQAHVLL